MRVLYSFWIRAESVKKGSALVGGEVNYQLDMWRDSARALYETLKKEFG